MAVRPILIAPDPILKRKANPVSNVDDEVRRLLDDMLETMYQAPGIGLAAPQVGLSRRVLVMDVAPEGEAPQPFKMINPEIVWSSEETSTYEEGCLSIPDYYAEVTRPAEAKARYVDETGEMRELHATGLLATCLQHEIDHLNGVLFIDRISSLKRDMILRKLKKTQKSKLLA